MFIIILQALGSVYLVHKSLNDVSLWNYKGVSLQYCYAVSVYGNVL